MRFHFTSRLVMAVGFRWSQIWKNAIDGIEKFISFDPVRLRKNRDRIIAHTFHSYTRNTTEFINGCRRLPALLKWTHKKPRNCNADKQNKNGKQTNKWNWNGESLQDHRKNKNEKRAIKHVSVPHSSNIRSHYLFTFFFSLSLFRIRWYFRWRVVYFIWFYYCILSLNTTVASITMHRRVISKVSSYFIVCFVHFYTGKRQEDGLTWAMKILWSILCVFKCNKGIRHQAT